MKMGRRLLRESKSVAGVAVQEIHGGELEERREEMEGDVW